MIKYGNISLTTTITLQTLYHLWLLLLVRLGVYIVNLSDFYSYSLVSSGNLNYYSHSSVMSLALAFSIHNKQQLYIQNPPP
jgi:hypothetical protein